ncbi:MAG: integrase core domain-containing protein [Candidatus Acidiferrales bacterium]
MQRGKLSKSFPNIVVESFHGKLRDDSLKASCFGNLFEAQVKIEAWRKKYN